MKIIPKAVALKVGRSVWAAKVASPNVLFYGGVTGVVATTVLACRATLKLEDVLVESEKGLLSARELAIEEDRKKAVLFVYVKTATEITKLYAPSIIVGAASIGALTGAHNMLNKRNVALTAAYAAVEKGYDEYRQRVIDEFGEDKDREYRMGLQETTVKDPVTKKKSTVMKAISNGNSPYARLFDEHNVNWEPTPEINVMFLRFQQNHLQEKLDRLGLVTLNDAYDCLGMPRSKAGMVMGWIRGDREGDTMIDFGIWEDTDLDKFHNFVTGREKAIWIDFNVSNIFNKA